MHFAVIVFPGTNCDRDVIEALSTLSLQVSPVWHQNTELRSFDALILPGGFTYGDTLRAGAIARFSPIMEQVERYAREQRGLILGICNGFQILTEAGLLPGALHTNRIPRFLCQHQPVQVQTADSPFTSLWQPGQILDLPVAHNEGNYQIEEKTLELLEEEDRIALRYAGPNPNGSREKIAGIFSEDRRILGLMPHPERNSRPGFGEKSGGLLFASMLRWCQEQLSPNQGISAPKSTPTLPSRGR